MRTSVPTGLSRHLSLVLSCVLVLVIGAVGVLAGQAAGRQAGEDGLADVARTRVLEALTEHNARSGDGFELRPSLGAEVWFPDTATTLAELVRRADEDMYAEKSSRPRRSDGVVRSVVGAAEDVSAV